MAVTSEEAWTYLEEQLSRSSKAEVNFAADFRLAHSILGEAVKGGGKCSSESAKTVWRIGRDSSRGAFTRSLATIALQNLNNMPSISEERSKFMLDIISLVDYRKLLAISKSELNQEQKDYLVNVTRCLASSASFLCVHGSNEILKTGLHRVDLLEEMIKNFPFLKEDEMIRSLEETTSLIAASFNESAPNIAHLLERLSSVDLTSPTIFDNDSELNVLLQESLKGGSSLLDDPKFSSTLDDLLTRIWTLQASTDPTLPLKSSKSDVMISILSLEVKLSAKRASASIMERMKLLIGIFKSTLDLCSECSKPNSIKKCSKCKFIKYCSTECQKNGWPTHKTICDTCADSAKLAAYLWDKVPWKM